MNATWATTAADGNCVSELPAGIERRVSIFGAPLPLGYGSADRLGFDYDSRGRLAPSPALPSTTRFIHYPLAYPPDSAVPTTFPFPTVRAVRQPVSINDYDGWEFARFYE